MTCNHDESDLAQTIDLTIPAKLPEASGAGIRLCIYRLAGSENIFHVHVSGDGIESVEVSGTFGVAAI